jgi:hypothetical protein
MIILKKTEEILKNQIIQNNLDLNKIRSFKEWDYQRDLEIKDISIWEEIYREPGNIGIYAAWDPRAEFYIIVYEMFLSVSEGIQIYQGPQSHNKTYRLAKDLGINLPLNTLWVEPYSMWLYR